MEDECAIPMTDYNLTLIGGPTFRLWTANSQSTMLLYDNESDLKQLETLKDTELVKVQEFICDKEEQPEAKIMDMGEAYRTILGRDYIARPWKENIKFYDTLDDMFDELKRISG